MSSAQHLIVIESIDDDGKVRMLIDVRDEGEPLIEDDRNKVVNQYALPMDLPVLISDLQAYRMHRKYTYQDLNRTRECLDHVGNRYQSTFQMCSAYGVSETVYRARIKHGWTVEEALTGNRKKVFDHLGNAFSSMSKMCQYHGVPYSIFYAHIKAGYSIEEALSNKSKEKSKEKAIEEKSKDIEDHLGNKYHTVTEMCKYYGIRLDLYCQRKKRGWTLEEILTGKKEHEVSDHNGNKYRCLKDMCHAYNISPELYKRRIARGWTAEEALSGIKNDKMVKDHLGNTYPSCKAMCEKYGIQRGTFCARLRGGWSLEEALTLDTTPNPCKRVGSNTSIVIIPKGEPVVDHLGNEYDSLKAMCNAYGIKVDTYKVRRKHGYSLEKALTRKPSRVTTNIPCVDHLGNHYSSKIEMARAYGISKSVFISRQRMGWALERILTTPINTSR